jgi:DNA-directed RNA polymerase specialized sigma subunit
MIVPLLQSRDIGFSAPPTLLQSQVDGLVEGFADQATDWQSLAAMMAGGMGYRLGRIGAVAAGTGRIASLGIGLGAEVVSFEMAHRSLTSLTSETHSNPNLWRWNGQGGIRQGLLNSLITFGTLKGAGRLAQGENVVVRHLFQDTAMVLGHQASAALSITQRPTGSLAEQFFHAEATNLQLGAGMALAHAVAPGLQGIESGLDLSIRSNDGGPNLVFAQYHGQSQGSPLQGRLALVMGDEAGRFGETSFDPAEPVRMAAIKGPIETAMGGPKNRNKDSVSEPNQEPQSALRSLRQAISRNPILPEEEKRELIRRIQENLRDIRKETVMLALEEGKEARPEHIRSLLTESPEMIDQFVTASVFFSKEFVSEDSDGLLREKLSFRLREYFAEAVLGRQAVQRLSIKSPEVFEAFVGATRRFLTEESKRDVLLSNQSEVRNLEDALVRGDLRFLLSCARGYQVPSSEDIVDLVNEGGMGLREGIRRFDLNRTGEDGQPIKFLTYADWWVRQSMVYYLLHHLRNVRIPVYQAEKIRRLRQVMADQEALGQPVEVSWLAKLLGIEDAKVHVLLELNRSLTEYSLDKPLKEGEEGGTRTRLDLLHDPRPSPAEEVADRQYRSSLRKAIRQFIEGLSREGDRRALEGFLRDEGSLPVHLRRKLKAFLTKRGFAPEDFSPAQAQETKPDSEPPPSPKEPQNGHGSRSSLPPSTPLPAVPVHLPEISAALSTGAQPSISGVREVLRPRIAIVGFGAAGMGASHHLRQPHLITSSPDLFRPSLTVFEGLDRPGGKIAPGNMGAQFADRYHFEPITTMIQRLGLKTYQIPDYDEADFITRDRGLLKGEDFIAGLQVLRGAARQALSQEKWEDLDRQGAVEFIHHLLDTNRLNSLQAEAMKVRLGFEEGTEDVSALSFAINLAKSASPMPRLEVEGGLYRLAEAEMSALMAAGGEVFLNSRVDRVDVLSRGVRLYFNQGGNHGSELFDFAILALSPEHLPHVEVNGTEIPLGRISALKPARINKTNLIIHGEFPGRELATPRYAKWFSRQPHRTVTFFSGWDGTDTLSVSEMIETAFGLHGGDLVLRDVQSKTWDTRSAESGIPHGYTTLPKPGQGFGISRLVQEQFFLGRYDKEPLKVANHVLGLGCYVRDAALAGEWAAIALLRSMGLTLKPNAQRNRNPIKEFFGIEMRQERREERFPHNL